MKHHALRILSHSECIPQVRSMILPAAGHKQCTMVVSSYSLQALTRGGNAALAQRLADVGRLEGRILLDVRKVLRQLAVEELAQHLRRRNGDGFVCRTCATSSQVHINRCFLFVVQCRSGSFAAVHVSSSPPR